MKAKGVVVPTGVIENKGEILDWAVMRRKGVKKEMVAENLEKEERALNQGIIMGEIVIIPDKLS
ncbi:MAG TPA: hypothetical protein VHW03_04465 [Chthoniobacterales bacterium]|nr:hypothetical protein [Chthoniobacterales bacterium]